MCGWMTGVVYTCFIYFLSISGWWVWSSVGSMNDTMGSFNRIIFISIKSEGEMRE